MAKRNFIPPNKINWTPARVKFLRDNYENMTNQQLADAIGLKLTSVRMQLYKLGLKRMELQYWTNEQVKFLKANYKQIGDTELAEMFADKWDKPKGWTKKHIEKKRRYLKLKRTTAERKAIHKRNKENGRFAECSTNMWKSRGITPVGERRIWETSEGHRYVVIKTENGFVHLAPYLYKKHFGPIPEGHVVAVKCPAHIGLSIDDLELITRAENARRNSAKFHAYPEDLKQTIKLHNKLKKHINATRQ